MGTEVIKNRIEVSLRRTIIDDNMKNVVDLNVSYGATKTLHGCFWRRRCYYINIFFFFFWDDFIRKKKEHNRGMKSLSRQLKSAVRQNLFRK